MGVMSCFRENCDKIMCDTYVSSVGYICWECKDEFKEYLSKQNISVNTDVEIERELKKFMETSKGSFNKGNEMTVDDFFGQHTRQ